jgi:hypothetical protein
MIESLNFELTMPPIYEYCSQNLLLYLCLARNVLKRPNMYSSLMFTGTVQDEFGLKGMSHEIETGCWWYEWIEKYLVMNLWPCFNENSIFPPLATRRCLIFCGMYRIGNPVTNSQEDLATFANNTI